MIREDCMTEVGYDSRDKDGCTPFTYVCPNGICRVQPWDSWG